MPLTKSSDVAKFSVKITSPDPVLTDKTSMSLAPEILALAPACIPLALVTVNLSVDSSGIGADATVVVTGIIADTTPITDNTPLVFDKVIPPRLIEVPLR